MIETETEKSADVIDLASQAEALATACAIAQARSKSLPESYIEDGIKITQGVTEGKWVVPECISCYEPIVEGLLLLGKIRCVDCQSLLEKRKY